MDSKNRLFDDLSKVAGGALGALGGLRGEIEVLARQRLESLVASMDLVSREEFEAVRDMAQEARQRQEALEKRVLELESQLAKPAKSTTSRARRTTNARASVSTVRVTAKTKAAEATAEKGAEEPAAKPAPKAAPKAAKKTDKPDDGGSST